MDRRQWLRLVGAAAQGLWLPRGARAQPHLHGDPFAWGVASGSPQASSVVLWTRLSRAALGEAVPEEIPVRWEVAHDPGFQRLVQTGHSLATDALDYSVHVELQGLAPERWYHYRFLLGDAVSTVGRTRTFPMPGAAAQTLRLAYASCQKWEDGHFAAWRHMQAEHLDAVLFLGDYLYEYPGTTSRLRVPPGGWVRTLQDYRRRYALYKSDPELQAMHAQCPWLLTWDDHEVQNDYAGLQPGDSGPPVADFAQRRAAAYQAYYENMPLRASVLSQSLAGLASGQEMRLYAELSFGRLASVRLLDARQYRDPQACGPEGKLGSSTLDPADCPAWNDPKRSLLGAAQERWLGAQWADRRTQETVWNVLGQSTLFGARDFRAGPGQRWWNDGWDGYGAARRRLSDALQHHAVPNPVILGGDVHENWVGHVKADYARPDSASVGVEFCGTSITSRSGKGDTAAVLRENPHFVFADSEHRGYGVAEFTPGQLQVTLRGLEDVQRLDSGVKTLARFVVEAGRPVVQPA